MADPAYATREARKANRQTLKAELERSLAERSARDWVEDLNRIGVPAGVVQSVPQVLAHPQVAERGLLADFPSVPGVDRDITVVRTGVKLDGAAPAVETPPPQLGAHNDEVYRSLGLSGVEIRRLREEGVL